MRKVKFIPYDPKRKVVGKVKFDILKKVIKSQENYINPPRSKGGRYARFNA